MGGEKKTLRLIANLEEEVGYYAECRLRGYSITVQDEGYLLVLKIFDRRDRAMVAFVSSSSMYGLWELVAAALYTTGHTLKWKEDKYFRD